MSKEERVSISRELFEMLWRYHVEQELEGLEMEHLEDRIAADLRFVAEMLHARRCEK